MNVLNVEHLTAGYSRLPVVSDVWLQAERGTVTAVVGPNGAGKSTALKAMSGVLRPMSGSVKLAGRELVGQAPHQIARSGMGYVPQVGNVFPSLTVLENLEMGAYTRSTGIQQRIEEVLAMFPDLRQALRRQAGVLSGGQRNMLGIARALMLDPRVLLLDEPTAGLAPAYIARVWDRVAAIAASGTSVVVVEQNVDLALSHADRAYVLIAGRNFLEGPAREVAQEDLANIFLGGSSVSRHAVPASQ